MQEKDQSLRDMLLLMREYAWELLKNAYWFPIVAIVLMGLTYFKTRGLPIYYTATVSMMINDDKPALSGIMQLAGQLGLGGGGGELRSEKIADLLSSQNMIYNALLKKITINGKKDLLFNHYLDLFKSQEQTDTDTLTNGFRFVEKPIASFTLQENTVAKFIYSNIINQYLSINTGKSGIIRANCRTSSEAFSKEFVEALANTLSGYYTNKAVEQQERTYKIVRERCDSLERALYSAEYGMANWIDENKAVLRAGTLPARRAIKQDQFKREAEILNVMYVEAIKNRELAHINLLMNTPIIQIIDYPLYPLNKEFPNRRSSFINALLAAIALTTVAIVFRKVITDNLKEA